MLYIIAFATFCSTMLGGSFALKLRDRLHLILGFSAGAVVGVAFFDLMPEALSLASPAHEISTVLAIVAFGFLAYLVVDRAVFLHSHTASHDHAHSPRGDTGAGTLSLHSFLDGVGIGLSFHVSAALGAIVALAVIAHDFSDGINTVSFILQHGGNRTRALRWLLVDAFAPVVGILATLFFTLPAARLGLLLALFSGFFLYIGASDLIPESQHRHPVRWTTISTVLGASLMYLVIKIAG